MGVKIRKKAGRLYLDVYHEGTRTWEALNLSLSNDPAVNKETMRLAEYARAKREQQIFSGQWGLQDRLSAKKSLYNYIEKISEGKSKRKDRSYKALKYLAEYPGGKEIQLGEITPKWFENFQEFLESKELAPQTVFSYAYGIKIALRQAVRDNIILSDPSAGIKNVTVPEYDGPYLELHELQQFSKVTVNGELGPEVKRAFIFACYCALRISDLKTLVWGDIEHKVNGLQIVKRMVKTGRRVIVPLHESAWKIINDDSLHNCAAPIFPLLAGSMTDTNKYLTRWAAKAGIGKRVTWHAARRTCPSLLHELGVDVYTIQKICGHTKIDTTALYTKVSDQRLRKAIDALPDIEIIEGAAE